MRDFLQNLFIELFKRFYLRISIKEKVFSPIGVNPPRKCFSLLVNAQFKDFLIKLNYFSKEW